MAILRHEDWLDVMHASKHNLLTTGQTPMRLLIRRLPKVAEFVFDKCVR